MYVCIDANIRRHQRSTRATRVRTRAQPPEFCFACVSHHASRIASYLYAYPEFVYLNENRA